MKIIILRHAERYESPLFETSLTEEGLQQAEDLVELLKKHKIDEIYASPFLRVLQTIYPYCCESGDEVNIENSFYECLECDEFTYDNYKHRVSELFEKYPKFKKIVGNYKSYMNVANLSHVETEMDIKNRVYRFIWKLNKQYQNTDTCILIVTHMTICNTIKKYFDNSVNLSDEFLPAHFEVIVSETNRAASLC
jgi:broad specificity phosphatase PhoE